MFEYVGFESVREIIRYFKNTLGINKDMQKYVQSIIRTLGEQMDAEGEALFKNLEGALATVATADQWLADPQFKSETITLLKKLNELSDDPEMKDMLTFSKEILQSLQDGLGRNDGEFMVNLSGALKTVADFNGIIDVIREYLTPTSLAYFGVASPIAAKILTHIVYNYLKNSNDTASSRTSKELNILRMQLNVQFETSRLMAGLFLIGKIQINLQRQILSNLSSSDSLPYQNAEILDQMEQESKQYLEYVAPFSPTLLKITHGIQLRIEEEMKADKTLLELNVSDFLDGINCFTHGDIVLEGLYENILTVSLISSRSSLTWRYLSCTYEQDGKLANVQRKFITEIKESIGKLFDIITKTQIYTQFSLWQALAIIYSNENPNFELHSPIASELTNVKQHYHQVLNETHIRDLLRTEKYTVLSEDNGIYDLLINLLRKRAFFEVSHQLFCSLRFPNNIFREVKIGALDVYNTITHPIDTIVNLACMPFQFFRHTVQTSRQIGAFVWNRPMRVLTSTAINSAIIGGIYAACKTPTNIAGNARTLASFDSLSAEFGGQPIYAYGGAFTPESHALIHYSALKNVANTTSVVHSHLPKTVLASTSANIISLPQNNFKREENLSKFGNRLAQIASIFQEEDHRLMAMDAQSFFNTIDQVILDNEDEVKKILSSEVSSKL